MSKEIFANIYQIFVINISNVSGEEVAQEKVNIPARIATPELMKNVKNEIYV